MLATQNQKRYHDCDGNKKQGFRVEEQVIKSRDQKVFDPMYQVHRLLPVLLVAKFFIVFVTGHVLVPFWSAGFYSNLVGVISWPFEIMRVRASVVVAVSGPAIKWSTMPYVVGFIFIGYGLIIHVSNHSK